MANLTGPDEGPNTSNWVKKIISISTNRMNIEFKSDDFMERKGFSASIHFTTFPNIECQSWLDMNKKIFKSPNHPKPHHYSNKCKWLITVDHDFHITLNFNELHVRYHFQVKVELSVSLINGRSFWDFQSVVQVFFHLSMNS